MVTLEPSIALFTCENAIRRLMSTVFSETYGPNWIEKVTTEKQRANWPERVEAEANTREPRGVAETDGPGLTYANFSDLLAIAKLFWADLSPALNKQADTLPLLQRFEQLRNSIAHGRLLLTFERELLSGIAGQIRNQVTLYMSTQDPVGEIYPRIESAVDCFGHTLTGQGVPIGELFDRKVTEKVLFPGDRVQFTVIGFDAHDRPLEWWFTTPASLRVTGHSTSGKEAELEWQVAEGDVGEAVDIDIHMRAQGSKYQRWHGFDHRAYFRYMVRPPVDYGPA